MLHSLYRMRVLLNPGVQFLHPPVGHDVVGGFDVPRHPLNLPHGRISLELSEVNVRDVHDLVKLGISARGVGPELFLQGGNIGLPGEAVCPVVAAPEAPSRASEARGVGGGSGRSQRVSPVAVL